jgi:hypothetical protein
MNFYSLALRAGTYQIQPREIKMRILACALLLGVAAPAFSQEETVNFRGGKFDADLLYYSGLTPKKFITPEPEGLRLRYTGTDAPPGNNTAGVAWHFHARGDFVATAQYEILRVEPAANSNGVGVELYLRLANKNKDGIAFGRSVHPTAGTLVTFNYMTNRVEDGARIAKDAKRIPTTARSLKGRLRLERKGTTLIASKTEGDEEEFQEFQRTDIGNVDVNLIRFAGLAGGDPSAILDMRMLEFRINGADLGYKGKFASPPPPAPAPAPMNGAPAPAPGQPPPPNEPRQDSGPRWIYLIIVVMLLVPLALGAAGLLFVWLRKSSAEVKNAPANKPASPAKPAGKDTGKTGITKPKSSPARDS